MPVRDEPDPLRWDRPAVNGRLHGDPAHGSVVTSDNLSVTRYARYRHCAPSSWLWIVETHDGGLDGEPRQAGQQVRVDHVAVQYVRPPAPEQPARDLIRARGSGTPFDMPSVATQDVLLSEFQEQRLEREHRHNPDVPATSPERQRQRPDLLFRAASAAGGDQVGDAQGPGGGPSQRRVAGRDRAPYSSFQPPAHLQYMERAPAGWCCRAPGSRVSV